MKCQLCPDLKGAIVQVQTGDWYHICCVNYHDSIWFNWHQARNCIGTLETCKDTTSLGGQLSPDAYKLTCTICKRNGKNSACIQCDFRDCRTAFHVRCAIDKDFIKSWEANDKQLRATEDDNGMYIFCPKHQIEGANILKQFGP